MEVTANKLVIGVDGSGASAKAVGWADRLARALAAEVVAVHAVGLLTTIDDEVVPSESAQDRIEALVAEWCAPLSDTPGGLRVVIERGPAALTVLRIAEREAADLIVVGARGVGGLDGLLLGSTSHHLAQLSPIPVLIVPEHPAPGPGD